MVIGVCRRSSHRGVDCEGRTPLYEILVAYAHPSGSPESVVSSESIISVQIRRGGTEHAIIYSHGWKRPNTSLTHVESHQNHHKCANIDISS